MISSIDGFKDYDEVEVKVNKYFITSISPNPATNQTTISYDATGANSAYIMLLPPFGNTSYNYIINTVQNSLSIVTSNLSSGIYTVILVVDGQVIDAKALQID